MLKDLWQALLRLLFGFMAAALVILCFVFFLSVPYLLERLSYYIGDACTWIIFIFISAGIILICVNYERD